MLQACEVLFAQNRPSRRWFLYIVSAARVLLVQNFIIVTDSVNLNLSRSDINSRLVHLIWLIKAGANAQRLFIFIHIHPTVVVQQIAKSCSGHRMQVRLTRFDLVRLLPTGRASNPSRGWCHGITMQIGVGPPSSIGVGPPSGRKHGKHCESHRVGQPVDPRSENGRLIDVDLGVALSPLLQLRRDSHTNSHFGPARVDPRSRRGVSWFRLSPLSSTC